MNTIIVRLRVKWEGEVCASDCPFLTPNSNCCTLFHRGLSKAKDESGYKRADACLEGEKAVYQSRFDRLLGG